MDEEFCKIMATALNIAASDVRDDLRPEAMKSWNSLAMVEIISGIETRYNVALEIDELMHFTSIGEIRSFLRSKGIAA